MSISLLLKFFSHWSNVLLKIPDCLKVKNSKWIHYWPPNFTIKLHCLCLSIRIPVQLSVTQFYQDWLITFLIFCMKSGFNKHIKVAESIFWKKLLLYPKWVIWHIFGPRINIFKLFFKSVWNCIYLQAFKSGKKW